NDIQWLTVKAEKGDAAAQVSLGDLYENGHGLTHDYTQAEKWYRKAAEQGSALGQFSLGNLYGHGIPQDDKQGAEWMRKAAEQGMALAQTMLGADYEHGHGVPQDYMQAADWYRKAAEQGNALGQLFLGNLYAQGHGVTKNDRQAVELWRKAAEQGNVNAQKNLDILSKNEKPPSNKIKQALYTRCVMDTADTYKSSNEAADVIAEGALGRCTSEKQDWIGSTGAGYWNELSLQDRDLIAEEYDRNLRKWIISAILDAKIAAKPKHFWQ
ncbi:MAG: sel1 repeat family protein, partial [Proteobacteria bacterium]|nr:sel1 repeat family protein [Pseudomonadota bacterium]